MTTGINIAPVLLEHAAQRAEVEGLDVTFQWGDAHHLPADDDSYDVTCPRSG